MENILYVGDLKKEWKEKQLFNINAFNKLDRKNLEFGERKTKRKLLIKTFDSGEKLYIYYPGKEANLNRKNINKNDFYPELILSDGKEIKTKTFAHVWDDISILKNHNNCDSEMIDISALATLFIRMAYIYDSKKIKKSFKYQDINDNNIIDTGILNFEYYEYSPSVTLLEKLGISTNKEINGSKIIPYLTYIDLIAQNEDCKYSLKKGESWDSKTGRMNTCLTFVSVIAYLEGAIKISEFMGKLQRGVAPISQELFATITKNRICKR